MLKSIDQILLFYKFSVGWMRLIDGGDRGKIGGMGGELVGEVGFFERSGPMALKLMEVRTKGVQGEI